MFRGFVSETVVSHILYMVWKSFFWSGLKVFKNWCFKKFPEKFWGNFWRYVIFLVILVTSKIKGIIYFLSFLVDYSNLFTYYIVL